jgi:hypothetical protein
MASVTKYFKRDFLSYMKAKDVDFIRDLKDKAYLFYKNCLVEITAQSVEEKQYVDFIQHVWDKQVIDRVYKKSSSKCDFQQFIVNISKTQDRYDSFRSVIGYMLHTYKNPYYSPAIILNDEDISDNPQGGTGKGIITEALSKFKNTCTINGKNFDPSKDFAFQRTLTLKSSSQLSRMGCQSIRKTKMNSLLRRIEHQRLQSLQTMYLKVKGIHMNVESLK